MKKFLIKLGMFVLLVVVCDVCGGLAFRYLLSHAKGGDNGRNNYIHNEMDEAVLLFGSSRCIHHYDPRIVADSLSLSCYNCGTDGNGIILFYPRFRMITERYKPHCIVYDIHAGFDLLKGEPNEKYLSWLRPYYSRVSVDSLFWDISPEERLKMWSSAYQYNSKLLQLVSDNVHPLQSDIRGYRPVDRTMEYDVVPTDSPTAYCYDGVKLKYLERLAKECKLQGIKLVFAISPQYKNTSDAVCAPLFDIAGKYDIPVLNHFCDTSFVNNRSLFYDSVHMNRNGATEYSKLIAGELKTLL
ncbi:MAG: hypothetical protein NC206_04670 [Bacteroides sp.]|nr:hypothetical protein [Roseburia sp.]MCM1346358.1 hypothetical protein [Bacteroides sp.]MCM1420293.1 hypothetical protein [Bacteroides sp.]